MQNAPGTGAHACTRASPCPWTHAQSVAPTQTHCRLTPHGHSLSHPPLPFPPVPGPHRPFSVGAPTALQQSLLPLPPRPAAWTLFIRVSYLCRWRLCRLGQPRRALLRFLQPSNLHTAHVASHLPPCSLSGLWNSVPMPCPPRAQSPNCSPFSVPTASHQHPDPCGQALHGKRCHALSAKGLP